MTYHNQVVGANGQRQAMFLENVQGFGRVLWRNFATSPDDTLLAISTSGCNAVTIDVAMEAKRLGIWVAALTSTAHADASTSRHESGKKLHDVADLVLDQQAPAGDSAAWIDGLETPVSPLSSVTAARSSTCSRPRSPGSSPKPARPRNPHRRLPPRCRSRPPSSSRRPTTNTGDAWGCSIDKRATEARYHEKPARYQTPMLANTSIRIDMGPMIAVRDTVSLREDWHLPGLRLRRWRSASASRCLSPSG